MEQLGVVLRPRLLPRVVGGEGDGGPSPLVPAPRHQHQLHLQQGHHVPSSGTGDFPRGACNQEGMFKNTSVFLKYHHLHQDKLWCVCRGIIGRYSRRRGGESKRETASYSPEQPIIRVLLLHYCFIVKASTLTRKHCFHSEWHGVHLFIHLDLILSFVFCCLVLNKTKKCSYFK